MQRQAEVARDAVLYNDRLAPLLYIFFCVCVLCLTFPSVVLYLLSSALPPVAARPFQTAPAPSTPSIILVHCVCVCVIPVSLLAFLFHFISLPSLFCFPYYFLFVHTGLSYNIYTIAPFTISLPFLLYHSTLHSSICGHRWVSQRTSSASPTPSVFWCSTS